MTWSMPAPLTSMLATSLAVIGARDLSFLSCRAYGKWGLCVAHSTAQHNQLDDRVCKSRMRGRETHTTAVMRRADAIRSVFAMMHNLRRPGAFGGQLLVSLGLYDGRFGGGGLTP